MGKRSQKWWWQKDKRKNACENRTKENRWTGVRTSGETKTAPSWLAQFAEGRLSGEKTNKQEESKADWGLSSWVGPPSHLEGVLSFAC